MSASTAAYRTSSGRCSYKAMAAAAHTKLRIREYELADLRRQHEAIPRVIRIVCWMLRGKESPQDSAHSA